MPSWSIHLGVAKKVNEKLKLNKDLFYLGNLVPDVDYDSKMNRKDTHFYYDRPCLNCPKIHLPNTDMFLSIYKTTIKNLLRSLMFWMAVGLVIGITFYECKNGVYSMYSYSYKEIIYDTDPRFVLELNQYKNLIGNVCISFVMYYAMPIFTVISTVLVLNRDYGDQFFEIEKAGGVRSWKYTGGRISALVTVNFALVFIACFLGVWLYLLTRVGPEGVYKMETGELLWDSAKRLIRFIAFMPLPTTLFYISFTYFLGNIFKNGWI